MALAVWGGPALAETLEVPGQYATIQAAIDAAQSGDTVHIAKGRYTGPLHFKNGIALEGDGANSVSVSIKAAAGPALIIEKCDSGLVQGIGFRHTNVRNLTDKQKSAGNLVKIDHSDVTIQDCMMQHAARSGIAVTGEGTPTITKCTLYHNNWDGVVVEKKGASPHIIDNTIAKNGNNGIGIGNDAAGLCKGNRCTENGRSGIFVHSADKSIVVEDNHCLKNSHNGIELWYDATARVDSNTCNENKLSGILAIYPGAKPIVKNNFCKQNVYYGIHVSHGAGGLFEGNTCNENRYDGIDVRYFNSDPTILENTMMGNGYFGLVFRMGASGTARGNRIEGNYIGGIGVYEQGTDPKLENNKVVGNVNEFVESRAKKALDNPDYNELYWMLEHGTWDKLEAQAARLRKSHDSDPIYGSKLVSFYTDLTNAGEGYRAYDKAAYEKRLKEWDDAYPKSVTRLVMEGEIYTDDAWKARGDGYAYTVTQKGWQGFRRELSKAKDVLSEAADLNADDPQVYCDLITVAVGRQESHSRMSSLVKAGLAIDPHYYELYDRGLYYLTPRWYGQPGDIERFAAKYADKYGDVIYARIAGLTAARMGQDDYRVQQFKYKRLKRGFEDLLADTEDNGYYLNAYAYIAAMEGDRPTAKRLFQYIGDDWRQSVWRNQQTFRKWRAYARGARAQAPWSQSSSGPVSDTWPLQGTALLIVSLGLLAFTALLFAIFVGGVVWLMRRS